MKTAYFDCFAGASGDMILGALIDAGISIDTLQEALAKLPLKGYRITAKKADKKHIGGTKFDVEVTEDHHHRHLKDIEEIIGNSTLSESVKKKSIAIFNRLAEAEAHVHRTTKEKIHFHEVGAVDAIIDITGAVFALESLGIERVHASRMHVGTGTLECAHGTLPVPPPATAELLKNVPVYSTGIEAELITPTGAAILTTLSSGFGHLPAMTVERTGYGLGSRDLEIPNILRVLIGKTDTSANTDTVQLIETNIDDMNPELYEHIMEKCFEAGARDVYLTPIIMKKNRPGIVLSVLSTPDRIDKLTNILFRETTTLGVRLSELKKRRLLERASKKIKTPWGEVGIKVRVIEGDETSAAPEYEDCRRIASEKNLPLRKVYEEVWKRLGEESD